jgi:hypothetical protein
VTYVLLSLPSPRDVVWIFRVLERPGHARERDTVVDDALGVTRVRSPTPTAATPEQSS